MAKFSQIFYLKNLIPIQRSFNEKNAPCLPYKVDTNEAQ
jgi:hypothetical protein